MKTDNRIVIKGLAPIHRKPDATSELTDETAHGMIVEVTGPKENGFFPVRTHYRYEGYMPECCLSCEDDGAAAALWAKENKWTSWSPYLDVHTKPAVQSHTILSIPRSALLRIVPEDEKPVLSEEENKEGWTCVGLSDGRLGYVRSVCIKNEIKYRGDNADYRQAEDEIRRELVRTAMLYMGTQYRWGGKTPLGIDCSGLTAVSYLLNGFTIYRDADILPGFDMREIPIGEMKEGDLIFFEGHVAMYTGNGEFVHSTAYHKSEGVVVNSLWPDSPVYREDLKKIIIKIGSIF